MYASMPSAACKGKGKAPPLPAGAGTKGKGKGKAPLQPPQHDQPLVDSTGKGKGRSPLLPKALSDVLKSKGAGKASSSARGTPISCTALLMDGRQLELNFYDTSNIAGIRAQVAKKLHVGKHRVKVACGADVPDDGRTASSCGISDGAVLTVIVLTPVNGVLTHFGVDVPDDVMDQKMQLHEDLFASIRPAHLKAAAAAGAAAA
eukprot:CAMPEP_0172707852 /NCGR_PEP_ID=MMETSP1074-20121228/50219_1 /TAXON_ID=2916 /ORGANISM="Ceratium fusus, Strain PA161109" /LENGTH=203 /DNA_ID=CAMNT_0013530725 /DNA_START=26 /DNA_END=633 /DNA_ORIENTATION=+